jgi:hypothetical protein
MDYGLLTRIMNILTENLDVVPARRAPLIGHLVAIAQVRHLIHNYRDVLSSIITIFIGC